MNEEIKWNPESMLEVKLKQLFALDGKSANISDNDIERRNTIAQLLKDWELIEVVNHDKMETKAPLSQIKVLAFKEKNEWKLEPKYNIGNKKEEEQSSESQQV